MPPKATNGDYKADLEGYRTAVRSASGSVRVPAPRPAAGSDAGAAQPRGDGLAATAEFLQLLARAIRQFHIYPPTSPLCSEAIAASCRAFGAIERQERLLLRITPRELIVDETGLGAETIVEQELVRRLHRAHVAVLEIEHAASPRDFARFCTDLIRCDDIADKTTLAGLLVEHGVDTIVPRMARRPEVLDVGAPPAPVRDLVDRDQKRRRAAPAVGPVDYLYPPEKGWVRLDPTAGLETVSLVDLAVLVDDPVDIATMLLRLTDDDPAGPDARDRALEQKFTDVAMLFAALDGHLARTMFARLARAVLAIDADRRAALLRRTILPGLLDGRADGAVLRDFPDEDLAESLCLLLELETAAPEVVTAALNRLDLPADRCQTVASLVDQRLQSGGAPTEAAPGAHDQGAYRYARRLVEIDTTREKSFAEFAAFDLSIDGQTANVIAHARRTIEGTDPALVQLDCLWRLVRLEPSPAAVSTFLHRALALFSELDRAARWPDLAAAAARYRRLAGELQAARPDVVEAIDTALAAHWNRTRTLALLARYESDDGRKAAALLLDAFGPSLAPPLAALLDDAACQASTGSLLPLMCERAAVLAPGLAVQLGRCGPTATRAIVRVLGFAGAGYEVAVAEHLTSHDEQTVRAALRALAHIGTARAAALVAFQIQNGSPLARAAEEALWHFPPGQTTAQLRDLLGRRDFVIQNPDIAVRLIDRASQAGAGDLDAVLGDLEALRFRVWNPELVRVAFKARGLRSR